MSYIKVLSPPSFQKMLPKISENFVEIRHEIGERVRKMKVIEKIIK